MQLHDSPLAPQSRMIGPNLIGALQGPYPMMVLDVVI